MENTSTRNVYSYQEYRDLMDRLVAEGKTTGPNQSEEFAYYTELNHKRMRRLDKTAQLTPELKEAAEKVDRDLTFLILTEAWCGDAAQNIPLFQKMAEANPHIKIQLVLRDENLDLMDQHLTNGGRAIPKAVFIDDQSQEILGSWGPRPAPAQQMVMDYKALPKEEKPHYSEFVVEVQKWYNGDKTLTAQAELVTVMNETIHANG